MMVVFYPHGGWDVLSACEDRALWAIKPASLVELTLVLPSGDCEMLALVGCRDGLRRALAAPVEYSDFGLFLRECGCQRVHVFDVAGGAGGGCPSEAEAAIRDAVVRAVCSFLSAEYYSSGGDAYPF